MSDELETAYVDKSEKLCRKKCEECFDGKLNLLPYFVSIMVIAIGFVFLILFLRGRIPVEIKVEETVEYATNSYIYPSCPDYVRSCKSRFPYKHTTKNTSAAFITFIICASCVLAIAIVCVAMLAINANKSELTRTKLCALYSKFDEIKISDLESELKNSITEERQKSKENDATVTGYYPKNKAAADIFKAYANAIAEL